jgi:succinyl-CoA synthetase alpha subunit
MSILADRTTKVIIQGITGREAASFTRDMLDYGTRVVAGVTPGKGGQQVHGVPVHDTVRQAVREDSVEASVISVPPRMVLGAALEALENGLELLVIVTERIPRKDVLEILETARAVGIASRSGGMTTEIANLLTTHGIGQSTCVSIGGDPIVGSNFLDLIPLFDQDPETKAVVLFCEPGGVVEENLAKLTAAGEVSIPIVAFVAGRFVDAMPGVRFGHAATIVEGETGSAAGKIEAFKASGIHVAEAFSEIVPILEELL